MKRGAVHAVKAGGCKTFQNLADFFLETCWYVLAIFLSRLRALRAVQAVTAVYETFEFFRTFQKGGCVAIGIPLLAPGQSKQDIPHHNTIPYTRRLHAFKGHMFTYSSGSSQHLVTRKRVDKKKEKQVICIRIPSSASLSVSHLSLPC